MKIEPPDGMRVTVWKPDGFVMIPVADVLAIPVTVTAVYAGNWDVLGAYPPERMIRFSFDWARLAGYGVDDIGRLAAEIASHLASAAEHWPDGAAEVRLMPVVDIRLDYIAVPASAQRESSAVPGGRLAAA